MKLMTLCGVLLMALGLSACISNKESTAVKQSGYEQGIQVVHQLPKAIPGRSSPIPGISYVFVFPESVATELVPVPFIGEVVEDKLHQSASSAYKDKFTDADPYQYALASLQKTTFYKAENAAYKLYPYVIIQQGFDDIYRASLVFHIEGDNWTGRYFYHLPTTYPKADFINTPPSEIKSLQQELAAGAEQLVNLLKRDEAGTLPAHGNKATVGSLFLVSGRISGLVSPTIMAYPNVDIVEDSNDHVIARIAGNIKGDGQTGGLLFGVHYFYKNQLHTYKPKSETGK